MIFVPASGPGLRASAASIADDDLQRLRHAPFARLAAFSHLALVRAYEDDAVLRQCRAVAARRRVVPHLRVHRRRHQHLCVGGKQDRRSKVIGEPVRQLRHQIGGGRRHHDQVGLARQPYMSDIMLVLAIEEVGENTVGRQRADRQRRDELLRRRRHDGAHRRAPFPQPADKVERLIGGDAAADDEQDALAGKGHLRGVPQGLISSTPQSSKSRMFLVATANPCARAIALAIPKAERAATGITINRWSAVGATSPVSPVQTRHKVRPVHEWRYRDCRVADAFPRLRARRGAVSRKPPAQATCHGAPPAAASHTRYPRPDFELSMRS